MERLLSFARQRGLLPDTRAHGGNKPQFLHQIKDQEIRKVSLSLPHFTRRYDEAVSGAYNASISNENALEDTFFATRELSGVGIGVGMDQMLDFFVNSKFSLTFIVDYSLSSSVVTRGLLEGASRLSSLLGRAPTREEFISLLDRSNMSFFEGLVSNAFTEDERHVLHDSLTRKIPGTEKTILCEYLKYKSDLVENSWIGSETNFQRVISAFGEHAIIPVSGNLVGERSIAQIGDTLKANNQRVSFVYLSNALGYMNNNDIPRLQEHLSTVLPTDDNTVILETVSVAPEFAHLGVSRQVKHPIFDQEQDWMFIIQNRQEFLAHINEGRSGDPRGVYMEKRVAAGQGNVLRQGVVTF